ncbi:MAG: type I-C CRISPR-associated protein Cas8c/Csd1 [Pirellulales bacterium]
MILQALAQLAENEQLVPDPDFEVKPVSWVIVLKSDGFPVEVTSRRTNVNEGTDRKPKYAGIPMMVPRQSIRTSGDSAFFLVDKSEYALGFDPDGKRPVQKLETRLGLFREQVDSCVKSTGEPAVRAVAKFLSEINSHRAWIESYFAESPWAANDLFAYQVGAMPECVHLIAAVREHWKSERATGRTEPDESSVRCLISGDPVADVGLFPLLKKVPGGTSSGVSLVSFNAKAFESYGLSGNQNAPVSREAAEKAVTALNRLLDATFPNPNNPQQALPRRNIKVSGDTIVCFWAASRAMTVQNALDALTGLLAGDQEENVAEVYRSVWRGKPIDIDASAFYVLILSGAQGRAIVRDWIETTLDETMRHLAEHYADLEVVRNARPKKGTSELPVVPLRWLMDALAADGKSDSTPASLEAGFIRAAFTGTPYPFQILQRALVRSRVEAGRDEWIDAARRDARASLIRAVLTRRRKFDSQASSRYLEVPVSLNPVFESVGYSLGALMAVLERLQQIALGDVNASVVDRYFSAASASPRSVFVRLLKNSRHHARKAADADERKAQGFARRLDRLVDFFCSRFDVNRRRYPYHATGIPAHLDLEQQGLFVLGYHQMRHWFWMPKEERESWEQKHPDAPSLFRSSRVEVESEVPVEA